MTIYQNPLVDIRLDNQLHSISETWKLAYQEPFTLEVLTQAVGQGLQAFKENALTKYMVDITDRPRLSTAHEVWLETQFYPELVRNRLHTFVVVSERDIIRPGIIKNILRRLNEDIHVEIFNKRAPAVAWLKSLNQ
ncbi:hypothetical protein [Eisenibacter elegans]|jgi:hypothetical protein|uniref:hypothetical protein n=1 Tax=Eisenibacter elegans TaxID=997 RepID=UPI0003F6D52C|nr:hypothetical protein [Eisenibacter elegans]